MDLKSPIGPQDSRQLTFDSLWDISWLQGKSMPCIHWYVLLETRGMTGSVSAGTYANDIEQESTINDPLRTLALSDEELRMKRVPTV